MARTNTALMWAMSISQACWMVGSGDKTQSLALVKANEKARRKAYPGREGIKGLICPPPLRMFDLWVRENGSRRRYPGERLHTFGYPRQINRVRALWQFDIERTAHPNILKCYGLSQGSFPCGPLGWGAQTLGLPPLGMIPATSLDCRVIRFCHSHLTRVLWLRQALRGISRSRSAPYLIQSSGH